MWDEVSSADESELDETNNDFRRHLQELENEMVKTVRIVYCSALWDVKRRFTYIADTLAS